MSNIPAPVKSIRPVDPNELDPEERMGCEQIRDLQLGRLKWSLTHAYENVAAYKKLFDDAGVHPEDVKELEDIRHFPYTDKAFLRDNYPFGTLATPMQDVRRVHASSGTTGKPTVVAYTQEDLEVWGALVARCFRISGIRAGDVVHNSYGYGLFTGGLGAHYGAEKLGCAVVPMSGGQTDRQVQIITDFQPKAILSTPTYLLTIGDAMKKQGIDPRESSLRTAVLGAEPWSEGIRKEIQETFDISACDIYGLSEVLGPGVAGESAEAQDGAHIWEDVFLPEVVDTETGAPLADGEKGELIFTSLTKQAMPIIRYRTRDLTRLMPGTARPGHRRMERITGRSDDMIILRGVNLFPSQIEELALERPELSANFILELTRPDRMDEMTVKVEPRPQFTVAEAEPAGLHLQHAIKVRIGSTAKVVVVEPGELPRSEGKAKRIYDMRPDAPTHG